MPPWECDNCHEEAKPVVLLRCPKCLWETEADEQEPPEQECSPCPLEGRVVALEAKIDSAAKLTCAPSPVANVVLYMRLEKLEARLHALELAIITDGAEIEKLKTLAEQGTDLFEEHDERLQALERPAAPAQRQPEWECDNCPYKGPPTVLWQCPYCKMEQEQPRQGAGL